MFTNSKFSPPPVGSSLENGTAHLEDHQRWSRRCFLKHLGISGGASLLLGSVPTAIISNAKLNYLMNAAQSDRILVLIRLKGGNDGINMIVPLFDYDYYANLRPGIRIPEHRLIKLDNDFGMPDSMAALRNLWDTGRIKVVNSVGYPDQNLSHFRSTDIWSSASDVDLVDTSGWLGRYLEDVYPDYLTDPPAQPPAIQIGGVGSIIFNSSDGNNLSVNVSNPHELFEIARNGRLYDVQDLPPCYYGEQLGYLRTVANSTYIYAGIIKEAYHASTTVIDYGSGSLREQLSLVARLIKGGLETKLYMVTLDGFDTHANQNGQHPKLLEELSGAVDSFYRDLGAGDHDRQVLCMSFSEFGRRVQQNASQGTDHGSAAPILLFGEGLNGSDIMGKTPDLRNLDDAGNLKFGTDFRELYADILENWLCIDAAVVNQTLGGEISRFGLGITCNTTSAVDASADQIQHQAHYLNSGEVVIQFELPQVMPVRLQIFNLLGQPVDRLFSGTLPSGVHRFHWQPRTGFAAGYYIYRLEAADRAFSRQILKSR